MAPCKLEDGDVILAIDGREPTERLARHAHPELLPAPARRSRCASCASTRRSSCRARCPRDPGTATCTPRRLGGDARAREPPGGGARRRRPPEVGRGAAGRPARARQRVTCARAPPGLRLRTARRADRPGPLPERSASRLLVLDGLTGVRSRSAPCAICRSCSSPGICWCSTTRASCAARLLGTKPSGGRVEILLERALAGHEALVQLSASKPIRAGLEMQTPGGTVQRAGARSGPVAHPAARAGAGVLRALGRGAAATLHPAAAAAEDRERYQSIFAREPGAVAAPTASLHFDAALAADAGRARHRACAS